MSHPKNTELGFQYVITETGPASSLDPLDADSSQNLPVARMLYLTPLEISKQDRLTSTLLESFRYDPVSMTIHWVVRSGLHYSDGTEISADDVAFSVLRMALARPTFPVIREIVGLQDWLRKPEPLRWFPSGVRVAGQNIEIQLAESVAHPLFRFCLELFSVIPRSCVDQKTNKMICKEPPTSGYYRIISRSGNIIDFLRVNSNAGIHGHPAPDRIKFIYREPAALMSGSLDVSDNTVVASHDGLYSHDDLNTLYHKYHVRTLAKSRFSGILLNPNFAPFKDKVCRQYFVDQYRLAYADTIGQKSEVEGSISSRIVPGYRSLSELQSKRVSPAIKAGQNCRQIFAEHPVSWGLLDAGGSAAFEPSMMATLTSLGQKNINPVIFETRAAQDRAFLNGEIQIIRIASGLWSLDPFGDMQMLFTPGLHATLKSLQQDQMLQSMLQNLRKEMPPAERRVAALAINQYLFDESIFNVVTHVKRLFFSSKSHGPAEMPLSITSPAPWQVFEVP